MDAPAPATGPARVNPNTPAATNPTRGNDKALAATTAAAPTSAPVGAPSRLDLAILRVEAKTALTQLGWKPAIAHAAVAAALAAHGDELTLERLIFESLRRCPVPKA